MIKLLQVILDKFKRPLLLVLVLLAAVLIVLGIVGGPLEVAGVSIPAFTFAFQVTGIVLGVVLVAVTLILDMRESGSTAHLPVDLQSSYSERLAKISKTQLIILRHIASRTRSPDTRVSEREVSDKFSISGSEAYYRLEHLRLLGFIGKENMGGRGMNYYSLSESYAREIRRQSPSRQVVV